MPKHPQSPLLRRLCLVGVVFLPPSAAKAAAPAEQATSAAVDNTAMASLERHHHRLSAMVKANAKRSELQATVDPMLDYHWLAEATLGGSTRAPGVCKERCGEFEGLLKRLVRRNYLRLIEDAVDRPVVFERQLAGRNNVFKVTTKVSILKNGRVQSMTLAYVMHEVNSRFTVRDIITDGVSLVRTYRYEFKAMTNDGGIARVIKNLESQLAK